MLGKLQNSLEKLRLGIVFKYMLNFSIYLSLIMFISVYANNKTLLMVNIFFTSGYFCCRCFFGVVPQVQRPTSPTTHKSDGHKSDDPQVR